MTSKRISIRTSSESETRHVAESVGRALKGGEIIELLGDVGAGKTTFVKGLAAGAGSKDHVTSPTFTVSQLYSAPSFDILHYDFYRISDYKIIKNEIAEHLNEPGSVVVMEWPEAMANELPARHIKISFQAEGEDTREISLVLPPGYEYLGEKL